MTDLPKGAPQRTRAQLPDAQFLCSDCRHGSVIAQKLQPWLLGQEAWQDSTPDWFWQVRCTSPKVSIWRLTVFCHPVVECGAFRPRKVLTTEDIARKQARKEKKKAKRAKQRRRRKRKKNKKKR